MSKEDVFKILKVSFTIIICAMTLLVNLTLNYFKEFESYESLFLLVTVVVTGVAIMIIQTWIENCLFIIAIGLIVEEIYRHDFLEKMNSYFTGWIKFVILFNILVFLAFKVFKIFNNKKFSEFGNVNNLILDNDSQVESMEFSNWSNYNIFSKFVSIITLNFNNIRQIYMFIYKERKIRSIFKSYNIFMRIFIIAFTGAFFWDFIGLNLILFKFKFTAFIINLILALTFLSFINKYKKVNVKRNKMLLYILPLGCIPGILYLTYWIYAQYKMFLEQLNNPFITVVSYKIPKTIFIANKIYPIMLIFIFSLVLLVVIKINIKNKKCY